MNATLKFLKKRDSKALGEIYAAYSPDLLRYISTLLGSSDESQDVLQRTWCRVIDHANSLKNPDKFPIWIRRIAHRESIRELQRKRRYVPLHDEPTEHSVGAEDLLQFAVYMEDLERVKQAMSKLSVEHREVIWLAVVDEMDHEQIAAIAEIPVGTSRSRLHHGIAGLKKIFLERKGG